MRAESSSTAAAALRLPILDIIGELEAGGSMEALRNVASVATNITSKTVTTVGSGLQAINPVTAVNRLRRRSAGPAGELDDELIAAQCKPQSSLTIKSCPCKNAPTTNALSVKSGFLLKRNAQGTWVNRFVCTVPHMFLYYFDGEGSDSPRGIIDMHLYNSLTIEGAERNILKLSPPPEAGSIKPYYFQGDPELLNQWMTSIHRDKYEVVRDERDAYQQLQEQFSGEIENVTKEFDASNMEIERLRAELAAVRSEKDEALLFAHGILTELGMGKNEVNQLYDLSSALSALRDATSDASRSSEQREQDHEQRLSNLEDVVQSKEALAKEAEARLMTERREWEIKSRELLGEIERVAMISQNYSSEKSVVEQRNAKLGDEKKVLIKEVKQLRRKIEEMHDESLLAVTQRETMEARQSELLSQLQAAQEELLLMQQNPSSAATAATAASGVNIDGNFTHDGDDCDEVPPPSPLDRLEVGVREGTVVSVLREEERDSFARPRISDVNQWEAPLGRIQDLVYVSGSANTHTASENSSSVSSGGSSQSVFSGLMKSGFGMSMFGSADKTVTIATTLERQLLRDDRSSSGSGIAASDLPSPARIVGDAVEEKANAPPPEEGVAKLKCLKCDGTVEGPKYSTCKCKVPTLNLGFPASTQSPPGRWPSLGLMKLAKDIIPGVNGVSEEE